jgi:hypothetical protein
VREGGSLLRIQPSLWSSQLDGPRALGQGLGRRKDRPLLDDDALERVGIARELE